MNELLNRLLYEGFLRAAEGTDAGTAEAGDAGKDAAIAAAVSDTIEEDKGGEPDNTADEATENDKDTIASGNDDEATAEPDKPYWPEDWREKAAQHVAAGDEKIYKKELKRLERITDPSGVYGSMRELEAKFSKGGLVRVPGKDATEEDVAEFNKAMGVPESPEDYFKEIKLENGAVIGELDKPVADSFAAAVHEVGATPAVVNKAMNWYFANQEAQAAERDEQDDNFEVESRQALKEEFGPAYKRLTISIGTLFNEAPGGTDPDADGSLFSRLMAGRMADGKVVGNDPDMVRFLVGMAREVRPLATVTDGGEPNAKSVEAEMAEIMQFRRDNKSAYFKDEKKLARYRELLNAQEKHQARS